MSDVNYHLTLSKLIDPFPDAVVTSTYIEIANSPEKQAECAALDIEIEVVQNKLRLLSHTFKIKVFKSFDELLLASDINRLENIIIFDNGRTISYINGETYIDFVAVDKNYCVENVKCYRTFHAFLKNHETETEELFYFVDLHNRDLRKISFISLSDKGRLDISYGLECPRFDDSKDLRPGFEKFKACFDDNNKSLAKFLKAAVISVGSTYPAEDRMKLLFESLVAVVEKARINFEVYLNGLSVEQIKKDYDEIKSKYFNTLSDILAKMSQNIIGLPIAISAVLLSLDKVKENLVYALLLTCILLVTTAYLCILLRVYTKDLGYVKRIFDQDFLTLSGNKFFKKYPTELTLFEEVRKRVTEKISLLHIIIESYFWIINAANLVVVAILLDSINTSAMAIFWISLILILLIISLRNYILGEESTENGKVAW